VGFPPCSLYFPTPGNVLFFLVGFRRCDGLFVLRGPRLFGRSRCLLHAGKPFPFVRCVTVVVGQPKQIWMASEVRLARSPAFRDLDKAERDGLADGWRYRMPVNAVVVKISVGDGQLAVVRAAVAGKLDLNPEEDAMG
jgi:hypothetical protein